MLTPFRWSHLLPVPSRARQDTCGFCGCHYGWDHFLSGSRGGMFMFMVEVGVMIGILTLRKRERERASS
jgi:hypothetical protein